MNVVKRRRVVCARPSQWLGADHRQQLPNRQFWLARSGLEQPEISIQHHAHFVPVIRLGIKIDSAVFWLLLVDEKLASPRHFSNAP